MSTQMPASFPILDLGFDCVLAIASFAISGPDFARVCKTFHRAWRFHINRGIVFVPESQDTDLSPECQQYFDEEVYGRELVSLTQRASTTLVAKHGLFYLSCVNGSDYAPVIAEQSQLRPEHVRRAVISLTDGNIQIHIYRLCCPPMFLNTTTSDPTRVETTPANCIDKFLALSDFGLWGFPINVARLLSADCDAECASIIKYVREF